MIDKEIVELIEELNSLAESFGDGPDNWYGLPVMYDDFWNKAGNVIKAWYEDRKHSEVYDQ